MLTNHLKQMTVDRLREQNQYSPMAKSVLTHGVSKKRDPLSLARFIFLGSTMEARAAFYGKIYDRCDVRKVTFDNISFDKKKKLFPVSGN